MDNVFADLLVALIGVLTVGVLALIAFFQRLGRRGRVILGATLTLLVLLACLSTQLGAIRYALSKQASPSDATLLAISGAYTTNGATLTGLSAHDGSALWRRPLDLFRPSGAVAGGVAYLVGAVRSDGDGPVVEALRLSDGAPLWRLALPGSMLPTHMRVTNGLLVATVFANLAPASFAVVAVSLTTHTLLWRASVPSTPDIPGYAALAAGGGLLFVGSDDGSVRALRLSDGSLAWTMRISAEATSDQSAVNKVSLGVETKGEQLIVYDSLGEVASLNQSSGATLWGRQVPLTLRYTPPFEDTHVTLTGSGLYLCVDGAQASSRLLMALNPATGASRWSRPADCASSTPIESGANLYTLTNNALAVLRASDGTLIWQGAPEQSDLVYTELTSDNGVIFVNAINPRRGGFTLTFLCFHLLQSSVGACPSQTFIAAFNGATGQRYWRTNEGYDDLLGVA